MKKPSTKTAALATAALLTLAGGTYAVAGSSTPTAITGSVTDKINDAVTAKYPGATVVGIESETGGTFEAHVVQKDGTRTEVTLDDSYAITSTQDGFGRGPGGRDGDHDGHGGPGHGPHLDTAALAKAIGVSERKLTAALDTLRATHDKDHAQGTTPPTTPKGKDDRRDQFATDLAKELGVDASTVKRALEAQRPAGRP